VVLGFGVFGFVWNEAEPAGVEFGFTMEEWELKYLMQQPRAILERMGPEIVRLGCSCKGCRRFTRGWDFGAHPWYYIKPLRGKTKWFNVEKNYYLCGQHFRTFTAARRVHGPGKVDDYFTNKYLDLSLVGKPLEKINRYGKNKNNDRSPEA